MRALLLSVVVGQCSGGFCPAPTIQRTSYPIGVHAINLNGMIFHVRGYVADPRTGYVTWDRADPANAAAYRDAVASLSRAAGRNRGDSGGKTRSVPPKAEPVERKPTARAEPIADPPITNFGVDPSRFTPGSDRFHASSPEARRFVEDVKDDPVGDKLHVTVIGSDDERAQVIQDLKNHPAFSGIRDKLMVQGYKPGDWAVEPSLGFQSGRPSITVQTARSAADPNGGKVVFRASDYKLGPTGLAEAIRKADPSYKPTLDPGPGGDAPPATPACPLGFTRDHWIPLMLTALVVFCLIHPKKRRA